MPWNTLEPDLSNSIRISFIPVRLKCVSDCDVFFQSASVLVTSSFKVRFDKPRLLSKCVFDERRQSWQSMIATLPPSQISIGELLK